MASGKKIVIYSTSDGQEGSLYDKMLDETSKLNQYYADKYSHTYKTFRGLKVGNVASDAMFNRVYLAKEELDVGDYDWFVYLDADSYIWNMDNDFIDLLIETYSDKLIIRSRQYTSPHAWATPVFINLKHENATSFLEGWSGEVEGAIGDPLFSLIDVEGRKEIQKDDIGLLTEYLMRETHAGSLSYNFEDNQALITDGFTSRETSIFIRHHYASTETSLKLESIEMDIEEKFLSLGI